MLLAIDTATQFMSVALHDGNNLIAEQTWQTSNNHSVQLGAALQSLFERYSVQASQLKHIAVCTGPGSYSGLRVGISFAKGLAAVNQLPLIGISAMDIVAAAQPHYTDGLIVVVQAGRGRVVVARYQWRKGHWVNRGDAQFMDWETLIKSVDGPAHLTGEISPDGHQALAEAKANGVPLNLVPAAFRLRRAGFLAQEAWEQYQANEAGAYEAARLVPIYIKTQDVPQT